MMHIRPASLPIALAILLLATAFAALPTVGMASKAVFGTDLLADGGIDWKPYMKMLGERPSVQRVVADRKAAQEAMAGKK